MNKDTDQFNFAPQKTGSPEGFNEDRTRFRSGSEHNRNFDHRGQEKDQGIVDKRKMDVAMLASESLISPVAPGYEPAKLPVNASNFAVKSQMAKKRIGSLLDGNRQLIFGLLIGFVLASISLAAFLYIRDDDKALTRQTNSNVPDVATTTETVPVANPEVERVSASPAGETERNESKPLENIPDRSQVRPSNNRSRTKQNDFVKELPLERTNEAPASLNPEDQTQLSATFNNLIKATNDRDVDQQMVYYAPQVKSYYRARNASPHQIRDEKQRVFGDTESVDIQASKPQITLGPDGRTATMRFRKKYSIKKGQTSRNGEVLQELKWVKSNKGWKIVSERDLKIIDR
jgi:hypothetical protein